MKEKMTWISKAGWIIEIILVLVGFVMFASAQAEIVSNSHYTWTRPYTSYEAEVLRMKYVGIILLVASLPALAGMLCNKKMMEKTRKESIQYYLRGGFVICPSCGLSVLGDIENCPRCNERIVTGTWDGKVDRVRTTIEVPMQTNNVAEVLKICQTVLEPQRYAMNVVDGEHVWTKGNMKTGMQCVGTVFTGKSVLIQGWIKDSLVGEAALVGVNGMVPKKAQKELLEKISLLIRSRKL